MLLYTDIEGSDKKQVSGFLPTTCRCRMLLFAMWMFGRGRMLSGSFRLSTARTALFSSRRTSLMWLNWKVMSRKIWMLGNFLTSACQRFEQKGVLSVDCYTELLRAVWHMDTLLEFCSLRPACLNLAIMDLFFGNLRTGTYTSDLWHTWPVCQIFFVRPSCLRVHSCQTFVTHDPFLSKFCY